MTLDKSYEEDIEEKENTEEEEKDFKKLYEAEKVQKESIAKSYKEQEAKANSLEATFKNFDKQLKGQGFEGIRVDGNNVVISVNKKEEAKEDVTGNLKNQLDQIKAQRKAGDIGDDEYNEKVAEIKADIKFHENNNKYRAQEEAKKNEEFEKKSRDDKVEMIVSKYPGVNDRNSDLFKKMNELAVKGINYDKNIDAYYQLAAAADNALKFGTTGKSINPADNAPGLKSSGSREYVPSNKGHVLSDQDRADITVRLGDKAAKNISKIFSDNKKVGNLQENDPYFIKSIISMES